MFLSFVAESSPPGGLDERAFVPEYSGASAVGSHHLRFNRHS